MTHPSGCGRALGILECSDDVQDTLVAPLRQMTALQVTTPDISCLIVGSAFMVGKSRHLKHLLCSQAAFDPATRARIECGNESRSISKRNFGFKLPEALIVKSPLFP